ncbi:MAG: hypothetical protein V4633_13415 [Pseudomonadota bacterium]
MTSLPLSAASIVAARLKGMKPEEMIRVSLVGALCAGNHVVHAKPGILHDWRWVRDLDVCLYVEPSTDWATTLKEIALQRPAFMSLWDVRGEWGAKVYLIPTKDDIEQCRPVVKWEYELDFLPWLDFENAVFLEANT